MSLRVVLFTRSGRPSGAQMAWRLERTGISLAAVLVEGRGKMVLSGKKGKRAGWKSLGWDFLFEKILEALQIKAQFFLRSILGKRYRNPVYLSIEEWSLDHPEIPLIRVEDHNAPETEKILRGLSPDLGILTNTRRIQKRILEIPKQGFLNLHLSALPKYAGLDSIFWALYHGEREIGVTVHEAAEEIDRGALLLQGKIPVGRLDDEKSLYEKALWLGTALMGRAVRQIEAGNVVRQPQLREEGSYFSWPTPAQRKELRDRLKQGSASTPSPPVKIVHVITRLTRGGAQENTLATALGLQRLGYDVTLVTGRSWGDEGEILTAALEAGLQVFVFPELVREVRPIQDLFALLKLRKLLSTEHFTLAHTHMSKAGFLGRWASFWAGVPLIVHTPHGHIFHSYFSRPVEKFYLGLEKISARLTDRLIALTERCRLEHLELGVGVTGQWAVVPSGVDPGPFLSEEFDREKILASLKVPSGKKIIGFIGRLAPIKGPRYFIEALPEIFDRVPEAHALILGDGEEKKDLEEKIRRLGINSRVTFLGHQEEIAGALSVMELLAVPSLNEGMGRVIVEAGFLAKGVIGTSVGGILDLIEDEKTGLLVKPRDPAAIARAAVRLLQDPGVTRRLGERLKIKVLNDFTERQMVDKINTLYRELLEKEGFCEQPAAFQTTLSGHRPASG